MSKGKNGAIATAFIQVVPSMEGFKDSVADSLGAESEGAGRKSGLGIASGIKKALAIAGIGAVLKSAVTAGGELEQNLGGTEAVFGKFANNIKSSAVDAYKTMGLSASDYMATANKMGSLFQGSGLDQTKSLELTSAAMQRAADVASVMGLDMSSAMESIAGAAKGNFTMLDNLGVAMNATTLEAYALEKGMNFKWETASNAEKAELAMKMFMDRTSQYAGNFAREAKDTFSGSFEAMTASWKNFLGNLTTGGDVSGALTGLLQSAGSFAKNLMRMLGNLLKGLIKAIPSLLREIPTMLTEMFSELGTNTQGFFANELPEMITEGFNSLSTMLPGIMDSLVTLVTDFLPKLVENAASLFYNLMPNLLTGLAGLVDTFATSLPGILRKIVDAVPKIFSSLLAKITEGLPKLAAAGYELFTSLVRNLPQIIGALLRAVTQMVSGIFSTLRENFPNMMKVGFNLFVSLIKNFPQALWEIVKAAASIVGEIASAILSGLGEIVQVGVDIVRGLWEGIQSAASWLWNMVSGWISDLWGGIKDFFGIHSPSRKFAWIGEMIDRGLGEGIEKHTGLVDSAMDALESSATRDLSNTLSFAMDINKKYLSQALSGFGSKQNQTEGGHKVDITISDVKINDDRDVRDLARELALEMGRY